MIAAKGNEPASVDGSNTEQPQQQRPATSWSLLVQRGSQARPPVRPGPAAARGIVHTAVPRGSGFSTTTGAPPSSALDAHALALSQTPAAAAGNLPRAYAAVVQGAPAQAGGPTASSTVATPPPACAAPTRMAKHMDAHPAPAAGSTPNFGTDVPSTVHPEGASSSAAPPLCTGVQTLDAAQLPCVATSALDPADEDQDDTGDDDCTSLDSAMSPASDSAAESSSGDSEPLTPTTPRQLPTVPLLPPLDDPTRKTLVLDLDGTLIASEDEPHAPISFDYCVDEERFVWLRPGLRRFLAEVRPLFEVVLFTAAGESWATCALDRIDPDSRIFDSRLYRDHTVSHDDWPWVKDLSRLGRDLARTVIVDDNPLMFMYQPDNALHVAAYDPQLVGHNDDVLEQVLDILLHKILPADDVRDVLREMKDPVVPGCLPTRSMALAFGVKWDAFGHLQYDTAGSTSAESSSSVSSASSVSSSSHLAALWGGGNGGSSSGGSGGGVEAAPAVRAAAAAAGVQPPGEASPGAGAGLASQQGTLRPGGVQQGVRWSAVVSRMAPPDLRMGQPRHAQHPRLPLDVLVPGTALHPHPHLASRPRPGHQQQHQQYQQQHQQQQQQHQQRGVPLQPAGPGDSQWQQHRRRRRRGSSPAGQRPVDHAAPGQHHAHQQQQQPRQHPDGRMPRTQASRPRSASAWQAHGGPAAPPQQQQQQQQPSPAGSHAPAGSPAQAHLQLQLQLKLLQLQRKQEEDEELDPLECTMRGGWAAAAGPQQGLQSALGDKPGAPSALERGCAGGGGGGRTRRGSRRRRSAHQQQQEVPRVQPVLAAAVAAGTRG